MKDKYLDLVRELKKLWNMKVTAIPIVIGVLGTVTKELAQGLEDWSRVNHPKNCIIEIAQSTESWVLEETCHSNFSEKPSANAGVKNSQKRTNDYIYIYMNL